MQTRESSGKAQEIDHLAKQCADEIAQSLGCETKKKCPECGGGLHHCDENLECGLCDALMSPDLVVLEHGHGRED